MTGMPEDNPETRDPKSAKGRRLYACWGIALSLLLALGLVCWLVVMPYLRIRAALARCESDLGQVPREVTRLGDPRVVARRLRYYRSLPRVLSPDRLTVVHFLKACGRAGELGLIEALADEEDFTDRMVAALHLGEIGGTRAVEPLIAALKDEEWVVRDGAAKALGQLQDVRAVGALTEALGDEKEAVRRAAAEALKKIRGKGE